MTFATGTGFVPGPPDKGGRPVRDAQRAELIAEAARNVEVTAIAEAKRIHRAYYGESAKLEGDQFRSQVKYLSNLIRVRRKGLLTID